MKSESLNKLAWKKLRQDKISFFALCYIVLTILIGVFAVVISPDSSPNANEMHIELAAKPPFTQILFLEFPKDEHNETSFLKFPLLVLRHKNNNQFYLEQLSYIKYYLHQHHDSY